MAEIIDGELGKTTVNLEDTNWEKSTSSEKLRTVHFTNYNRFIELGMSSMDLFTDSWGERLYVLAPSRVGPNFQLEVTRLGYNYTTLIQDTGYSVFSGVFRTLQEPSTEVWDQDFSQF